MLVYWYCIVLRCCGEQYGRCTVLPVQHPPPLTGLRHALQQAEAHTSYRDNDNDNSSNPSSVAIGQPEGSPVWRVILKTFTAYGVNGNGMINVSPADRHTDRIRSPRPHRIHYTIMGEPSISWESVVAKKRALRDAAIAPFLVADDSDLKRREPMVDDVSKRTESDNVQFNKITDIDDVQQLQECIRRGEFTAEDVVLAYIRRCA